MQTEDVLLTPATPEEPKKEKKKVGTIGELLTFLTDGLGTRRLKNNP